MSCQRCGINCFGPLYGPKYELRDVAQATINVLADKGALLRELVEASKPIVEWREKLDAWDGGSAIPPKPRDWEWNRFREAVEKAKKDG
jgi:hypothetical protein